MSDDYYDLHVSYAKLLGSTIDRFKTKRESPYLASGRCPVCAEGTSKTKTRFFIYEKNHELNCVCHNCQTHTTLIKFLKLYNKQLFDEFLFEKFRNSDTKPVITDKIDFTPVKNVVKSNLHNVLDLPLVSTLSDEHPAKIYIKDRKLPSYPFYFASQFYSFSTKFNNEFKSIKKDEPRIIIPFFDRSGNIFAYQGRSLYEKTKLKYITVKINPKTPLLFGFERLDLNKEIYLFEGPLDSLFIQNSIASVNASLSSTAQWFLQGINKKQESLTLVYDNENRNVIIVKEYEKAIDLGYKIVIWPKLVSPYKDANAMIINGLDPESIIKKHTYQGLEARINFNLWKRV